MSKKEKDFSGLNMMINNISNKNKGVHQIEKTNEIEINKDEVLANYNFEFEVDEDTLDFLKEQTFKLQKASNRFHTEIGKIFKETQEKLAQHRYGCFAEWFSQLGFKKDFVYRYIGRYNLIVAQSDNRKVEKIEALPVTLSYEIAKEECPELVRERVINGEIKSVKELKEAIKEVKREEEQEAEEVQEAEIVEHVSGNDFGILLVGLENELLNLKDKFENGGTVEQHKELVKVCKAIQNIK